MTVFQPADDRKIRELIQANKPLVIYFREPSSNLCQLLDPLVDEVCSRLTRTFNFVSVNVSEKKDLSYEMQVMRCPAFVLFRNGEEIRRMMFVKYSTQFKERFREFLLGNFHFDDSAFQRLDAMNFFARVDTGFQVNVVGFLQPGVPLNWELAPVLRDIKEKYKNSVIISLVNANKSPDLIDHCNLDQFPSVVAFQKGQILNKWHPITDVDQFQEACEELIK